MKKFEIYRRDTDEFVTRYEHTGPIEFTGYEFATHEHREVGTVDAPPATVEKPTDWLIDIGPFFDRFGVAKKAVRQSTNPDVMYIVGDALIRKWIDLRHPDTIKGVRAISMLEPVCTQAIADYVLSTPVKPEENLSLRTLYSSHFEGLA